MTRQHISTIAKAINEVPTIGPSARLILANKIALVLAEIDLVFDHDKFIEACMEAARPAKS